MERNSHPLKISEFWNFLRNFGNLKSFPVRRNFKNLKFFKKYPRSQVVAFKATGLSQKTKSPFTSSKSEKD